MALSNPLESNSSPFFEGEEQPHSNSPIVARIRERDSFYQLIQAFVSGEGAGKFIDAEPSLEEINPLFDEIIFATGSVRKATMESSHLNNVYPPFKDPMAIHRLFNDHIANGDGALKKRIFLGYIKGIPTYAESAAVAESSGNNPYQEARNKAEHIALEKRKTGKTVLVIGLDAVDWPDRDGDETLDSEEALGKPMHTKGFPQKNRLMTVEGHKLLNAIGSIIYRFQLKNFYQNYKDENYKPREGQETYEIIHINAGAIFKTLADGSVEEVLMIETILKKLWTQERHNQFTPYPDIGGGGASQQFVDWDNPEEIFNSLDKTTQELSRKIYEEDPRIFMILIMYQIQGMPVLNVSHAIESILAEDPVETVVFQAS